MKKFRLLRADEIECRIQSVKKNGLVLLLYKTARTDADLLDETVGCEHWENDFKVVDGVLYGGIGVDYGNGMTWKWDAGTESNTEAEKGRASDAFKRAGFKHGIGRELYSAPFTWIKAEDCNIENSKCFDTFTVSRIEYDEQEHIKALQIVNDKTGKVCFNYGAKKAPAPKQEKPPVKVEPKKEETQQEEPIILDPSKIYYCENCGNAITSYRGKQPFELITWSAQNYGKKFCGSCIVKASNPR